MIKIASKFRRVVGNNFFRSFSSFRNWANYNYLSNERILTLINEGKLHINDLELYLPSKSRCEIIRREYTLSYNSHQANVSHEDIENNYNSYSDESLVRVLNEDTFQVNHLEHYVRNKERCANIRREYYSKLLNQNLEVLDQSSFDYESISGRFVENTVGFVSIPVGIVGPLPVNGTEYYVPLATTESFLVASAQLGADSVVGVDSGEMNEFGVSSFVLKNGRSVVAECVIGKDEIEKTYGLTVEDLVKLNNVGNLINEAVGGQASLNTHAANIVSAIFIACGQDPSQIVTSSQCFTNTEIEENGDLYISCTMPYVDIAESTSLDAQQACLDIIGAKGDSSPDTLSQVICSTVLCGELALLAALKREDLVKTYMKKK